MAAWTAVLPTSDDLNNAMFFDSAAKAALQGTTTEDALESLPIRAAFDSSVLPFMKANAALWPPAVGGVCRRACLRGG